MGIFDWFLKEPKQPALEVIEAAALRDSSRRWVHDFWDGDKFSGGFGPTTLYTVDYWTLRARSVQLFEDNLYARGMIRRLITNEINTGLTLEARPDEELLGMGQDALADWSETVENRFHLWGQEPALCHQAERMTFGGIQRAARMEALIHGDVLIVIRQDRRTGLPRLQLISGDSIHTPIDVTLRPGRRFEHGVELDENDRHVAYWVVQRDNTFERLPAFGARSGRRIAWLMYGIDKQLKEVRGKPLLTLVLQSLKEIDRYRDAVQRKAVINSMLAMFIKKTEDKPGTRPLTTGAIRRGTDTVTDDGGTDRTFNITEAIPGLVLEELQTGEEPMSFQSNGTDEKFGEFEEAIIQAVAWANEVPPEIMRLSFSNNYSASQAAINEFKIYLNRVRTEFGEAFCQPIYKEWLISETLKGGVSAPGFLEAWRDRRQFATFGAWNAAEWSGHIKPSTDIFKQGKGYQMMVNNGWTTNARAARELTGTKFSKNIKQLRIENKQKREVNEILGISLATDIGFEVGEDGPEDVETNGPASVDQTG